MHHCKCFSLFQAVAFLTQPTPVSGVENEGIGPKPVISSTLDRQSSTLDVHTFIPTKGSNFGESSGYGFKAGNSGK